MLQPRKKSSDGGVGGGSILGNAAAPQRSASVGASSSAAGLQQGAAGEAAPLLQPLLQGRSGPLQRANSNTQRPKSTGKRAAVSPALDLRRGAALSSASALKQPPAAQRQKDKFVPLSSQPQQQQQQQSSPVVDAASSNAAAAAAAAAVPGSGSGISALLPGYATAGLAHSVPPAAVYGMQQLTYAQRGGGVDAEAHGRPTIFEDLESEEPPIKGRITAMTLAEGLDRKRVEALLRAKFPRLEVRAHQDVVHATPHLDDPHSGDIFFFDYGTVVFWGISAGDEQAVLLSVINPCKQEPLELSEVEIDEFTFHYSLYEPPSISNDTITLSRQYAADHQVKLAISHALAQSTLLGCYEERLQAIVEETRDLPDSLAQHGRVSISRKQTARLIGQVFLQRSAVNLLGVVLDVPEFFWSAPDHLQVLYKRVCEYLELETRVEVLNTRYDVLQEMLEVVRDHQNNAHMTRLEMIVIYLIFAAVVIGLLQVAGLIGFVKPDRNRR